jgi:uncharacterized protein YbcI
MIREGKQEQDLTYLSSYFSKMIKLKFGKGPEMCSATMRNNLLVVRVQHFMTSTEKVLCENNEVGLALRVRSILLETIFEEIRSDISALTGLKISSFYHDWDFESDQGLLLFVAGSAIEFQDSHVNEEYELTLSERIQTVCERVHKRPIIINILKMSSSICAVECLDALIKTEHLLHRNGYHDILMERSVEIRKCFHQFKEEFEEILNSRVSQTFLFWDYDHNKSYLIFCLK